jgi:hypothetical protein
MTENSTPEAPPVRVPNVSAGAKSGLAHEVIGANAQAAYDENQRLAAEQEPDAITVPAGTMEERLAWVSSTEDPDERGARADAIYQHEVDTGSSDAQLAEVSAGLRQAVYQDQDGQDPLAGQEEPADEDDEPVADVEPVVIPEDKTTVPELLDWVGEDPEQSKARAEAVLAVEREKPEDDQRSTLVEPLEALVAADEQGTAPTHADT